MAIDALNDRSYNSALKESVVAGKTVAAKNSSVAAAAQKTDVAAPKTDAVVLTDSAKTLSKATQKAKDSSGIDEVKVEKLKAAIKDGSYKIDYESVANKLIDSEDELSSIFG